MSLSALPSELLQAIAQELQSESDVNSLVRVNQRFYHALNRYLYRRNDAKRKGLSDSAVGWAASKGRAETILRAEALGIAIPAPSLIAEAAMFGGMGIVKLLFENVRRGDGAPPDLDDPTALILALENGHDEIFRFLIQEGADLEGRGANGDRALHVACEQFDRAAAMLLLERGANIEATDDDGRTPLHRASYERGSAAVQFLVAHGANVHARDNELYTPLHLAADQGNIDAIKTLLGGGADIDAVDGYGWTPLLAAVENAQPDAAVSLIESGAGLPKEGVGSRAYSVLSSALTYGHDEVAGLLIRRGASLEAGNEEDRSPLLVAATYDRVEIGELLLDYGANAGATTIEGLTALDLAIVQGHNTFVKMLRRRGVVS